MLLSILLFSFGFVVSGSNWTESLVFGWLNSCSPIGKCVNQACYESGSVDRIVVDSLQFAASPTSEHYDIIAAYFHQFSLPAFDQCISSLRSIAIVNETLSDCISGACTTSNDTSWCHTAHGALSGWIFNLTTQAWLVDICLARAPFLMSRTFARDWATASALATLYPRDAVVQSALLALSTLGDVKPIVCDQRLSSWGVVDGAFWSSEQVVWDSGFTMAAIKSGRYCEGKARGGHRSAGGVDVGDPHGATPAAPSSSAPPHSPAAPPSAPTPPPSHHPTPLPDPPSSLPTTRIPSHPSPSSSPPPPPPPPFPNSSHPTHTPPLVGVSLLEALLALWPADAAQFLSAVGVSEADEEVQRQAVPMMVAAAGAVQMCSKFASGRLLSACTAVLSDFQQRALPLQALCTPHTAWAAAAALLVTAYDGVATQTRDVDVLRSGLQPLSDVISPIGYVGSGDSGQFGVVGDVVSECSFITSAPDAPRSDFPINPPPLEILRRPQLISLRGDDVYVGINTWSGPTETPYSSSSMSVGSIFAYRLGARALLLGPESAVYQSGNEPFAPEYPRPTLPFSRSTFVGHRVRGALSFEVDGSPGNDGTPLDRFPYSSTNDLYELERSHYTSTGYYSGSGSGGRVGDGMYSGNEGAGGVDSSESSSRSMPSSTSPSSSHTSSTSSSSSSSSAAVYADADSTNWNVAFIPFSAAPPADPTTPSGPWRDASSLHLGCVNPIDVEADILVDNLYVVGDCAGALGSAAQQPLPPLAAPLQFAGLQLRVIDNFTSAEQSWPGTNFVMDPRHRNARLMSLHCQSQSASWATRPQPLHKTLSRTRTHSSATPTTPHGGAPPRVSRTPPPPSPSPPSHSSMPFGWSGIDASQCTHLAFRWVLRWPLAASTCSCLRGGSVADPSCSCVPGAAAMVSNMPMFVSWVADVRSTLRVYDLDDGVSMMRNVSMHATRNSSSRSRPHSTSTHRSLPTAPQGASTPPPSAPYNASHTPSPSFGAPEATYTARLVDAVTSTSSGSTPLSPYLYLDKFVFPGAPVWAARGVDATVAVMQPSTAPDVVWPSVYDFPVAVVPEKASLQDNAQRIASHTVRSNHNMALPISAAPISSRQPSPTPSPPRQHPEPSLPPIPPSSEPAPEPQPVPKHPLSDDNLLAHTACVTVDGFGGVPGVSWVRTVALFRSGVMIVFDGIFATSAAVGMAVGPHWRLPAVAVADTAHLQHTAVPYAAFYVFPEDPSPVDNVPGIHSDGDGDAVDGDGDGADDRRDGDGLHGDDRGRVGGGGDRHRARGFDSVGVGLDASSGHRAAPATHRSVHVSLPSSSPPTPTHITPPTPTVFPSAGPSDTPGGPKGPSLPSSPPSDTTPAPQPPLAPAAAVSAKALFVRMDNSGSSHLRRCAGATEVKGMPSDGAARPSAYSVHCAHQVTADDVGGWVSFATVFVPYELDALAASDLAGVVALRKSPDGAVATVELPADVPRVSADTIAVRRAKVTLSLSNGGSVTMEVLSQPVATPPTEAVIALLGLTGGLLVVVVALALARRGPFGRKADASLSALTQRAREERLALLDPHESSRLSDGSGSDYD